MNVQPIKANEERCRDLSPEATLARIKRYIMNPPENSRVFTITPDVARELLNEYNRGNRTRKPRSLQRYMSDMKENKWYVTGDTIKFSDSTLLRDGQHRLMACVASNTAFVSHVIFGVDDRCFAFLDRGKNRSGDDALEIAGKANTRRLSAAARWWKLIESDRVKLRDTYEPAEILAVVDANPQLEKFVAYGQQIERQYGEPSGLMAAIMYGWHRANPKLAAEATKALCGGAISARFTPFRKVLAEIQKIKAGSQGRVHDVVRAALWVKAWNLVVDNRSGTARDLTFKASIDAFPAIKG